MVDAMPKEQGVEPKGKLHVQPLSLHIGAEISGVDLSNPLSLNEITEIWALLLRWKVIFFRDQPLDHNQHVALARQFGKPTIGHAVYGHVEGHPEIYALLKARKKPRYQGERLVTPWTGWHTDVTPAHNPPVASILRGGIVPPYGGDTQFTNLVTAYNGLSATMRAFLDGLRGVHRFTPPPEVATSKEYNEQVQSRPLASEHPLVRVHPETGERVLFVSPMFLKSIVGLSPRESQKLLELLWEHSIRPEYTVRFKWEPGSLAIWDNRATAHLAPVDIRASEFDRLFYRITLVGDVPVGVDGSPSMSIEGDPILAI